mgnify:CR=1 FL=1
MNNLFVIIVTYKGRQWYDRCFTSLRESTMPVQTIVVDNASNDGTVEYIRKNYPETHLIESKENLGFGKANNLAMRYALDHGCDYVFLLNQDAWVEPDTFEKMVDIHQRHPEYGILSPIHLNAAKNGIEKGLINYLDDKRITDKRLFEDLYFGRLREVYQTKYVNAAAWLLPVKTLETVGGFDPIFTHYGEDDNYLDRALFHKMKVGVCPSCVVVHDTERRVKADAKKVLTERRNLLADVTDINVQVNLKQQCFFHFRKAIAKLLEGADAKRTADILRGNQCGGRGTSCADQLAQAIDSAMPAKTE